MPIRQFIRNWTFGRSQQTRKRRPVQQRGCEGQLESLETRTLLAAQISGGLYHDLNADGVHDSGENGLADWTVFLDTNANGALDAGEASQRTDVDGLYHFTGLAAGNYHVTEVPRAGWSVTNPTTTSVDVAVASGDEAIVNFLNQGTAGTGVITGLVWRDINNDQVRDPEDTPLASWTMFLDLNGDQILDPNEPSALTDGDGIYTFTNVLGGNAGNSKSFEVTEMIPTGWEPKDVNITAEVVEGQTIVMPDFSNWPDPEKTTSVSGRVFNDANNNGILDTGEVGLGGWTVYADVNLNGFLDAGEPATTTATNGNYSIGGLEAGGARIIEIPTGGFSPTSPATGVRNVTTTVGVPLTNVNFGNRQRTDAAIGGVIYVDRDKNGVRDPGEEGLSGIRVYIDTNDNGVHDLGEPEMETEIDLFYTPDVNEAGRYRFDHLPGGTYIVRQELPVELSGTPATEIRKVINLGPSDDLFDLDGGDQYRSNEIHGIKFEDVNGNHVRDAGEPGIPDVTIFIDLNRNNIFEEGVEPSTLTAADGSYAFLNLEVGAYIVREVVPAGWAQMFPQSGSPDGILWPAGVSNLPVGNVSPDLIQISLAEGETHTQTVSLTLPTTGALTNMVDVFLLFDDTGSFTSNSPIVRAAFPGIIAQLQTRLTGIDLGFGVGRLEEYGSFASEYANGRPFILNQPIVAADVGGFEASIQSALDRVAPGYGGDGPETVIEALYQMVTGAGFDGNNNGNTSDSGAAGLASTQTNPGSSGDVPAFSSFMADPANGVLSASGTIGGAGFRSGALPIIITATDTGFAYQSKGETTITGIDGTTLPASAFTDLSRGSSPFSSGAGIQETVTGLNALGALVIGLGTADSASAAPRSGLEALATMTGAINQTATTIANGTADPIATGDPFYFKIGSGGDPLAGNIADGIVAAIDGALTSVNVNVTVRASDPRVHISFSPGVINGLGAGDTATFDVTFTGDGRPSRFDLQFIREGTDVVLGSIPVVMGTPVSGEGYEYEDCEDGEHSSGVDFGNQRLGSFTPNAAPTFVIGTSQTVAEDSDAQTVAAWATDISPGSPGEASQLVDFVVSNNNNALFAVQPVISADGTLSYTPAANANGSTVVTVQLHDNGGTASGGVDISAPQTFTINLTPVNDAPTGSVVITGTLNSGHTVTADISSVADVDGLGTLNYAWSTGATTPSITLTDSELGQNITVTVSYTDGDGTMESLTSAAAKVNSSPTGTVLIQGTPIKGGVLTANGSGIADADGLGPFTYLWSNGATTASINLSDSDVGQYMQVSVIYTDGHGTQETLSSAPVGPVAGLNSPPFGDVIIDGSPTEDATLTANTSGIADADGIGAFSYQWSNGATTAAITLSNADVDTYITVTVSYIDGHGTPEILTSAPVGPIANVNDVPTGVPTISGTAQNGQTLTARTTGISDADGLGSFNYQWLQDGVSVTGATASTYLLTAADVGTRISVQVSYTDGHGTDEGPISSVQTSAVTDVVTGGETKFLVVDQSRRSTYEYDVNGDGLGNDRLNKEDETPRGIAARADGSVQWVVDEKGEIFIYDNNGKKLGSWEFKGVDKAEGVTVHGDDLWIVDRGEDRIYFFQDGALRRSGKASPTNSFRLTNGNKNPMDLVTDGTSIWVVNSTTAVDKVFRYSMTGTPEGSWTIDSANSTPTGITVDPTDVNHIWIVDAGTDSVFQYNAAASLLAGTRTADYSFALHSRNANPQGIAGISIETVASGASSSAAVVARSMLVAGDTDEENIDLLRDRMVAEATTDDETADDSDDQSDRKTRTFSELGNKTLSTTETEDIDDAHTDALFIDLDSLDELLLSR